MRGLFSGYVYPLFPQYQQRSLTVGVREQPARPPQTRDAWTRVRRANPERQKDTQYDQPGHTRYW